jgi:nitrogen regulatory protein PII-like uncharacterized protein
MKKFSAQAPRPLVAALVAALTLSLAFLSGCIAGKLGLQTVKVNYYPDCYKPITELRADSDKLKKNVLTGALTGALTGVAGGAALGVARAGNAATGALVGAAVGAAVDAGLTYVISDSLQQKARADRFASYNATLETELQSLNNAVTAGNFAAKCYSAAYKKLSNDYKRNKINREEMLARLKEIRDGSNDAKTILTNYKEESAKAIESFDEIVKLENERKEDRATKKEIGALSAKKNNYVKKIKEVDKALAQVTATFDSVERDINLIKMAGQPQNRQAVLVALR